MDHEFVCESCESKVGSLEELMIDEELRERVGGYIETEIARSKKEKEEEDEQAGRVGGEGEQQADGGGEGAVEPEGQGAQGESGQEGKDADKVCYTLFWKNGSADKVARCRRSNRRRKVGRYRKFDTRPGKNARNAKSSNYATLPISSELPLDSFEQRH